MGKELVDALRLATHYLDQTDSGSDPDSDICVLSRQLNRAIERGQSNAELHDMATACIAELRAERSNMIDVVKAIDGEVRKGLDGGDLLECAEQVKYLARSILKGCM